jgi:membrane protein DedA with SNARE-associated domain
MSDRAGSGGRAGVGFYGRVRKRIVPAVGLLLALGITGGIFYFYWRYPGSIKQLEAYGLLGAFFISIILNATLILPVSNIAVMIALGVSMSASGLGGPILVGVVGGFGAAIGEMTGYLAGRSGRGLVARRRIYHRVEGWVRRWGWLTIFVLSAVPFIFDLVGIAAGALRLPVWKFFVPCWLGRTIAYVTVVTLAALGLRTFGPWFG